MRPLKRGAWVANSFIRFQEPVSPSRPSFAIVNVRLGTALLAAFLPALSAAGLEFPGPEPGEARAKVDDASLLLENQVLLVAWQIRDGRLRPVRLVDKLSGTTYPQEEAECFAVELDASPLPGGSLVAASQLQVLGKPELVRLEPNRQAMRRSERSAGWQVAANLGSADGRLMVQWRATLRDGSNYVRQRVSVGTQHTAVAVARIVALGLVAPQAAPCGVVDGSPVASGTLFFGCEHPASTSEAQPQSLPPGNLGRFQCSLRCQATVEPNRPVAAGAVVGVVPQGQLRRSFLYYLERERPVPYRPLLHYNNGTEIGCEYWKKKLHGKAEEAEAFRKNQQQAWVENIRAFGRELVNSRGVTIDSFAHDFEWDDETLVWQFHQGYPDGFAPAQRAAGEFGASLGVWLSPWGGYPCKKARLEKGRELGFETNALGLSLAGPRYYARFAGACRAMILQYGVNYFKFDGFGPGNNQTGPGPYASDVEALLRLLGELRQLRADVFINPSTGSWPSPFWLLWADAIWRQGSDTGVVGKGSERQKWITYRDSQIYQGIVQRAPLYPINSLMIHGVFINALPLFGNPYDPKQPAPTAELPDVVDEIRSFFGTGTNLQEMYIEPKRMTPAMWDALAEAARWSRANSDVLVDTHWIGGDPAKGEVYGWASWSKRKAILVLRNPNDQPAQITLNLGQVFELPAGAAQQYALKSPWKEDAGKPALRVTAAERHAFALEPFAVRVWEAQPER